MFLFFGEPESVIGRFRDGEEAVFALQDDLSAARVAGISRHSVHYRRTDREILRELALDSNPQRRGRKRGGAVLAAESETWTGLEGAVDE